MSSIKRCNNCGFLHDFNHDPDKCTTCKNMRMSSGSKVVVKLKEYVTEDTLNEVGVVNIKTRETLLDKNNTFEGYFEAFLNGREVFQIKDEKTGIDSTHGARTLWIDKNMVEVIK